MSRLAGARKDLLQVAAVSVVIAGIVAGPGLLHGISRLADYVFPAGKPRLTVRTLGPVAVAGKIATGAINGKRWQIRLRTGKDWDGAQQCAPMARRAMYCDFGRTYLWSTRFPDRSYPAWLNADVGALYGQVRPTVTKVSVRLSDGDLVKLRPVTAYGRHWIGLVLPEGLLVAKVTAYSGGREIAHSVPYVAADGHYNFLTWLPPGDPGPARVTKVVDAAVVPGDMLYVGPWGNCIGYPNAYSCFPVGYRATGWGSEYPNEPQTPRSSVIAVPADAAYMLLTLTNHRIERVRVLHGAGVGFVAVRVLAHPWIAHWELYDAAGNPLSGGKGPPDRVIR